VRRYRGDGYGIHEPFVGKLVLIRLPHPILLVDVAVRSEKLLASGADVGFCATAREDSTLSGKHLDGWMRSGVLGGGGRSSFLAKEHFYRFVRSGDGQRFVLKWQRQKSEIV
jgi:hypothetical protein